MTQAFESWIGSDTFFETGTVHTLHGDLTLHQDAGSSWDIVKLGTNYMPGVCTVTDIEIGRDIDQHKKKGKDGCFLRDNGLSPITFDVVLELIGKQWQKWQEIWPSIQPKEGGIRTPLEIVHPLPNSCGIQTVYIHRVKIGTPSARKGMRVEIKCGKWFEKEPETKAPNKKDPKSLVPAYQKPDYNADPNQLARALQHNAGYPDVVEPNNMMANAFGSDPPKELLPGEAGYHGIRTVRQPAPPPKRDYTKQGFNIGGAG